MRTLPCGYSTPGYGSSTFESRFSIAALVYEKNGLSLFGQDCGLDGWLGEVFPHNLPLDGVAPGDVFIYDTDARPGEKYGHAVMVAAVVTAGKARFYAEDLRRF